MIEKIEFNIPADSIEGDLYEDTKRFVKTYTGLIDDALNQDYDAVNVSELCVKLDTDTENVEKIEINGSCYDYDGEEIAINITIKQ